MRHPFLTVGLICLPFILAIFWLSETFDWSAPATLGAVLAVALISGPFATRDPRPPRRRTPPRA